MTSLATDLRTDRPEAQAGAGGHFRPDIEGLRAVAILTVLAFHAGLWFVPGGFVGVDVFFVISGFLITGLLVNELSTTGGLSISRFYARRIKRLLPAVVVVLVATSALSWLVLSPLRRGETGGDIISAGLYYANWHFGLQNVGYLGATKAQSPVLHFWSLAVEEQFYVVWPLLLLLLTRGRRLAVPATATGARRPPLPGTLTRPMLLGLGAVFVPSALYCVYLTRQAGDADWGYYSSLSRAWELALGGGVAMTVAWWQRLPRPLAMALGWAGLAAVLWSALRLSNTTAYPGTAAFVPTLGAAAMLAAGAAAGGSGAARLLSTAPMRHVGRISYSWYLWHWPLLILSAAWVGHRLAWWAGVLVVAFSYLPTIITHRLVEEPFRRSQVLVRKPARALAVAAVCTTLAVAAGVLLRQTTPAVATVKPGQVLGAGAIGTPKTPKPSTTKPGKPGKQTPGAASSPSVPARPVPPPFQESATAVVPAPSQASGDKSITYQDGCHRSFTSTDAGGCVYGDTASATTVVLYGDSHAAMWFPPLRSLATAQHWRLISLTKSGCPASDFRPYNATIKRAYTECVTWHRTALARIAAEHPALVIVAQDTGFSQALGGRVLGGRAAAPALTAGLVRTLHALLPLAGKVALFRDTPSPPKDIPDCVSGHLDHLRTCGFPREVGLRPRLPDVLAAAQVPQAHLVDLNPFVCPGPVCAGVIGNVIVYTNGDHITATYASTMAPLILADLAPLLPRPQTG